MVLADNGSGGYLKMYKVVKYIANKKNTYLPYLWDIRLKIKGRYISLDNVSKNQRFGR